MVSGKPAEQSRSSKSPASKLIALGNRCSIQLSYNRHGAQNYRLMDLPVLSGVHSIATMWYKGTESHLDRLDGQTSRDVDPKG